jgi:hypothetical protein
MSRAPSPRHLVLRAALRRGDPGAGAVLAPAEEEAMRRATLDAAAASDSRRAGWLARPPRPAGPAANRARHRGQVGHLGHPGHPGAPRRWALRPLGATAAAAAVAAICVAVAVSWVSWQGRPWPRPADEAGPRPRQQRSAAAARSPRSPALGPAAAAAKGPRGQESPLDGRAPRRPETAARRPVAAGDQPGELGHTADAAGTADASDTVDAAEAAGRPAPDARQGSLAGAAPAEPSVTSIAVADPGPEPGARAAAEAADGPALLAPAAPAEAGPSAPSRQVQFSLPGGTRVIWLVREPADGATDRQPQRRRP